MTDDNKRTAAFSRNKMLENLLNDINTSLWPSEKDIINHYSEPELPVILIMGPMRSGTTLLMQWLASTGIVAYPSNLLSRFYNAPVIGAKIQLMLTDQRYNFRNELGEYTQQISFSSDNGKTTGALAPNEFWYFWRRFLAHPDRDDHTDEELMKSMDTSTMLKELAGIIDVFKKPFACKGMLFNYNIQFLNSILRNPVFIYVKRNPIYNMQSVLHAREKQLGSRDKWYSFRIKEHDELMKHDPVTQVAGQIHFINDAIHKGLEHVPDSNKITVEYERFCETPNFLYSELARKLGENGHKIDTLYSGPDSFATSERWYGPKDEKETFLDIYKSFD